MTGATRPDIPAVPTVAAETSGAESPAPGPAKPAAATTWPSSGMSAEAWNEAAAAIPAEWVGAAEGHYSMHGAGLIRNILAGVAPLIRAAERERIRHLAIRNNAVCAGDEGTYCFFADLIQEPS